MRNRTMFITISVAIPLLLSTTSVAELRVGGFMDGWEPRNCFKPSAPFIPSSLGAEYDIREYNAFIDQANSYISCIEQEGMSTLKKAREAVQGKIEEEITSMKSRASTAKSALELSYRTR